MSHQNIIVKWLLGGRFVRSVTQGYLGVAVPLYLLALGYSTTSTGILLAVAMGASALLTVAVGVLADRIGRKPILVTFGLLTAAAGAVFAAQASFVWLIVAAALGTIGQGGGAASGGAFGPYYPAEQALIAELSGDAGRTRAFTRLSFVGGVGGIFGAGIAAIPALLHNHGWLRSESFVPLFVTTIGMGIVMALLVLPIRERRAKVTRRMHLAPLAPSTRKLVARFMLTNATNGLAIGFLGPILVLWFHLRYGVDSAAIASLYAAVNLLSLAAYLGVARIVRLFGGAVRTIVGIRVISCSLLAAMPFASTFLVVSAIYLLRMLLNLVTLPVRQSYVMGVIPAHERSRAAAATNLPSRLGAMLGPATAGALFESAWLGLPLEIAAGLQLLNAWFYWHFFRALHPPEERLKLPPQL